MFGKTSSVVHHLSNMPDTRPGRLTRAIARARLRARLNTVQGELSTARLYCFRGAENFRNNKHYVNHRVFDEDIKVQFKTTNKYRIFWPITDAYKMVATTVLAL